MSSRYSINLLTLFLFLYSMSSCHDKSITGHWHIHSFDLSNSDYMTLDILQDSVAILNKYASYGGVTGSYSTSNKEIKIPGECGVGYFKYSWSGNDLQLENDLQEQRKAIKCDSASCDLFADVLYESKLHVSLPQVFLNRDCLSSKVNSRYFHDIIVGKPKLRYAGCYIKGNGITLAGKFAYIDDIPIWIDEVKSTLSERKASRILFQIFADKDVSISELAPIVAKLLAAGERQIFIATLSPDFRNSDTIFEHIAIQDINLESELTIGELLF